MGQPDDQLGVLGGPSWVQMGPGVVGCLSGAQGDLWSCLSAFILGVSGYLCSVTLGTSQAPSKESKPARTLHVSALQ